MNRYTVVQPPEVDDELATLWLDAANRAAVTAAMDAIERDLSVRAEDLGEAVGEGVRVVVAGPLWVYFTVHPEDCIVRIWSIRRANL